METQTILELVETYKNYGNSLNFIYAAAESLDFKKTRNLKRFIKNAFLQNKFELMDSDTCKKLSTHWKNVADTKLEENNYTAYMHCMSTSNQFAVVSKFLETNTD